MLAIADCTNHSGGDAWPSMAELCRKTKLSERGIQKAIRRCEELGELRVTKAAGRGRTNRYAIVMETPNRVRGFEGGNPEQSAGFSKPRTECGVSGREAARQTESRHTTQSSETPNVVRETPNHVRPEPSRTVTTDARKPGAGEATALVPEQALPLVRAVQATLPGLRWNLSLPDWLAVQTLMSKKGVEAMADYAARVSASSAKPVFSARYFLPGWKELPDAAPDGTAPPQLRAVTSRRQQETDDMFERALQRARARDAMETGQ